MHRKYVKLFQNWLKKISDDWVARKYSSYKAMSSSYIYSLQFSQVEIRGTDYNTKALSRGFFVAKLTEMQGLKILGTRQLLHPSLWGKSRAHSALGRFQDWLPTSASFYPPTPVKRKAEPPWTPFQRPELLIECNYTSATISFCTWR